MVITARVGLFLWLLGITVPVSLAFGIGYMRAHPAPPDPPPPCVDRARIELGSTSDISCSPGARLEIYPAGHSYTLFKCTCFRSPAAPAADAAAVD